MEISLYITEMPDVFPGPAIFFEKVKEEVKIELLDLKNNLLTLFQIDTINEIGLKLYDACSDKEKLETFCDLVNNDLSKDWLQMIYQYYLADREEKKQDFTPASLALLLGELVGDSNDIIDMCAGSGALIIQSWTKSPDKHFTAYEVDENVIPFLIFNLVVRNIESDVFLADVLSECEYKRFYKIRKGERFGQISAIEPAI